MNRICSKLRSGKGASITFALLLFLVCAVLCSVIITAASTASGRMASMAVSDQRYYAVTSACSMLKEMIDGETVTIRKEEGSDDASLFILSGVEAAQSTSAGLPINNSDFKSDSIVYIAAYRFNKSLHDQFDFDITGTGDTAGATCKAKMKVTESGDIIITVYKTDKANNPFTMEITFTADVKPGKFNRIDDDGNSETIKTTTITWSFATLKTLSMQLTAGA